MDFKRRAFTLVELIVVVGIITVLMTILVVTLRTPRGTAHQAVCGSKLRDIAAAATYYANMRQVYPAGYKDANTRWMDLIEDQVPKDSEVYLCPADTVRGVVTGDPDGMRLSYGINGFSFTTGYSFYDADGLKKFRITRPAETILFADCDPGLFYCGQGATFPGSGLVDEVSYRHLNSGFCAVFCDGHTEPLGVTTQEQWDPSPSP